jgi:hypothetical protein
MLTKVAHSFVVKGYRRTLTIEEFTQISTLLERIATAFEQQNKMNASWIVEQREWHQEDIAPLLVAIHEQDAEKNEQWRNEQREILAAQVSKIDRRINEAHKLYLEGLKAQEHPLQATIDLLCERVDVQKPDWNNTERNS